MDDSAPFTAAKTTLPVSGLHGFLRREASRLRPVPGGLQTCIVVAHPDDETLGCGGMIQGLPGVLIVHMTDGAPLDPRFRQDKSRAAYASLRRAELLAAMAQAGVRRDQLIAFGIADLTLSENLEAAARALRQLLETFQVDVVLTHAFEGGHPDHDAAAYCVHLAAELSRRPLEIYETPFYRAEGSGMAYQSFAPADQDVVAVTLSHAEAETKRKMLAAYKSQQGVLRHIGRRVEPLRRAPAHDFLAPPNAGDVLYERFDFGVDFDDVRERFLQARKRLLRA